MLRVLPLSVDGGGPGRREWEGRCCCDQATAHAKGSVGVAALEGPERATCATFATHPHAAATMLAGLRAEESCALVCPRACRPRGSDPADVRSVQRSAASSPHALWLP